MNKYFNSWSKRLKLPYLDPKRVLGEKEKMTINFLINQLLEGWKCYKGLLLMNKLFRRLKMLNWIDKQAHEYNAAYC